MSWGVYPIFHHAPAMAGHGRYGKVAVHVIAADDFVNAVLGEKLGPFLDAVVIQAVNVGADEVVGFGFDRLRVHYAQPMISR